MLLADPLKSNTVGIDLVVMLEMVAIRCEKACPLDPSNDEWKMPLASVGPSVDNVCEASKENREPKDHRSADHKETER